MVTPFLLLTLLITLALVVLFSSLWFRKILDSQAPFIPITKKVIPKIIEALELKNGATLYDLGCGDARVLIECAKLDLNLTLKGVEKNPIAVMVALVRARINKQRRKIDIIRGNFFHHNLSDATHIFTFLLPKPMNDLFNKLKQELKPGTILVSCDFPFTEKTPEKTISLNRPKGCLARTLYVYKF